MLGLVLLLLLLLVAVGVYQTRPAQLAAHATLLIEQATGASAHIDKAYLSRTGEIELENVSLRLPNVPGEAGRLFEAQRIIIRPNFLDLLAGRINVRSLGFIRPRVYLTEWVDEQQFNFQALMPRNRPGSPESEAMPTRLPSVSVRHAQVHFGEVVDGQYHTLGLLQLEGNLGQARSGRGTYYFALRQQTETTVPGPTLSGRFSLLDPFFDVDLEDFSFDQPQGHFLPRNIREFWRRLEPRGVIPRVTFHYDPKQGQRIELQLRDGSLTLPVGEVPPRLTQVNATFDMLGQRLIIRDLTGHIKGIVFHIEGEFDGLGPTDAFRMAASTDTFTLPDDPEYLFGLPPVVSKHYQRYKPSGQFRVNDVTVFRQAKGEPIQYQGELELLNVSARYHRFPYPGHDAHGTLAFTPEKVTLDIQATAANNTPLTVTGTISPPNDDAVIDLQVTAKAVHLDAALVAAMEPKHRKVYRLFFDDKGYERWLDRGLLRTSSSETKASESSVPIHDLGGTFDIVVDIERAFGRGSRFKVTNTLTPRSASLFFGFWHYPVTVTKGTVVIAPDRIDIHEVFFTTPTGGSGILDGTVGRQPGQPIEPDLTIHRVRLPINDLLLASVPEPQNQWCRELHLGGVLLANGSIGQGEDQQVDWDIDVDFDQTRADPFASGYALADLRGAATLTRHDVTLVAVTGARGQGTLAVDGQVAWGGDDAAIDLRLVGRDLPIESTIPRLIPLGTEPRQRVEALFETYQPGGVTDVELQLTRVGDRPMTFSLALEPEALDLDYRDQRLAWREMVGKVSVKSDLVELLGLGGRFGEGSFTSYGNVYPQQGGRMSIHFTAQSPRLDPTTRALLPMPVQRVLDGLAIEGGYEITTGRLATHPLVEQGPTLEFAAQIALRDVSANLGAQVTSLDGELDVRVVNFKDAVWPSVDLQLHADRLKAQDRLVSPFQMQLISGQYPDTLDLRSCRGAMYGGQVIGEGQIQLGEAGGYRMDLRLVDVDVDAFRDPKTANAQIAIARETGQSMVYDTGTLSASFALDQRQGDPASRRGRGAMRAKNANLYDNPLSSALIEAINLRLPTSSRFDRAGAQFLVEGNQVLFDELWIESPTTSITGGGEMHWDTRQLHLALFTRNNSNWNLGPISDMFNVFKDELLRIEVEGTLESPKTRVHAFTGVTRFWGRLLGLNADHHAAPEPITPQRR